MEFIQNLPKPQPSKSNFCKSYFDIPKYAQMEKILVFRNMLRCEHMDEYGIGTDCIGAVHISDSRPQIYCESYKLTIIL